MGERILTVYGNTRGFKTLKAFLVENSYTVFHASFGEEAMNSFRQKLPDVVILDLQSEDIDGLELLKQMKAENPTIEVITIAGYKALDLAIKSLSLEVSDYLLKPIRVEHLAIVLNRAKQRISFRHALGKSSQENTIRMIEEERLAAVCQVVEGLPALISNISDDLEGDTKYFNEMPCFVSIHNPQLKVVATNQLYKDRLGDKIGHNSWEVYMGKAADREACPVGKTFKTGMSQRSKEVVENKYGKERIVMVHTSPIKNKKNEIELVLEMAADIRAVKRLKEELHTTQRRYQQLFDEAPCYIYVQDRHYRLTAINKRFKKDFGDETGSHCYRVYKDRTEPCHNCPLEHTYKDGRLHQAEMVMTSKTGEKFTVVLWTAPIRNEVGEIIQVMVMATNITQIRELQDHLSSLGLMIGSISHGAKGLLTGLDAGIYMVDSGFSKNDQSRIDEGWEIIKLMTDRIRSLVLDILYYAKERELNWEKVDVLSFTNDVALTVGLKIRSQRIHFRCNFDDSLGEFEVDAGIVHSALINILENAVEACLEDTSDKSHTISLGVSQNRDYIIFDVQDNGLGMDEATRKNMFNIFFSSKGKKGTGLGLYLSNKIIQQHGGVIEVKSEIGKGSHFSIKMPKILPQSVKAQQIEKPRDIIDPL